MPSMFDGPDLWGKLETDPRTKDYFKDPTFLSTINAIKNNPNTIMQFPDPRYGDGVCFNGFSFVFAFLCKS